MESITLPNRDKKMIIWNFMEELCRKHNESINDGQQPVNLTDNGLAECRKPVHDWV